jgi:hypothetical protein
MNQADPVMQDVWRAKAANATKHQSLAAYMAFLRKRGKRKHPGGRIGLPANAEGQLLPELR